MSGIVKQMMERETIDQALERGIKERPEIAPMLMEQLTNRQQMREAAIIAWGALERLVEVMKHGTGQGYKLRSLLWSLYNGKPASLICIVGLDWEIRRDLASVMLGWGWEDQQVQFFYRAMKDALSRAQLWAWFEQESESGGAQ